MNPAEKGANLAPLALDIIRMQSEVGCMKWITGEKILERWGEIDDKLIEVFKEGLYPYRDLDGARLTPDSKCFRCRNANDAYIAGEFNNSTKVCERPEHFIESLRMRVRIYKQGLPHLQNGNDDVKTFFVDGEPVFDASLFNDKNLRLRHDKDFLDAVEKEDPDKFLLMFAEGTCSNFKDLLPDRKELFRRLKAARFRLKDVQAFEDLHGIGSTTQPKVKTKDRRREIIAIPTKPGTTWPQIKIRIVNNTRLEIKVHDYDMAPYDPKALGINPARQGDVTMWEILTLFAKGDGSLPPASKDTVIGKSNITNFRKLLKRIFPDIEGDPVKRWHRKRGYQCVFEISGNDYYLNANSNAPDIEEQDGDYTDLIANRRS